MGKQLLTIWQQLGINQRISVVLATLGVLGGLAGLVIWSSRVDYVLLYGRLDEAEAAKVIAALEDSKTPYKVQGGGAIYVPADKKDKVRTNLAGRGIPRAGGGGYALLENSGFGVSDFLQHANYKRAIEGELARTIGQFDMVESAWVGIVVPENALLMSTQKKPTASVFVEVRGNGELPQSTVNSIRFLVANAVQGLTANNVSVVDNHGKTLGAIHEENSVIGLANNQLSARTTLEQYLARKAEDVLIPVVGPGRAIVRVSADINWDSRTQWKEEFDPQGVIRKSMLTDDDTETTTPSSSGVPGVVTNAGTDTNSVATSTSSSNSTKNKKKVTDQQYEINRTVSSLLQNGGELKRLTAAVFVAQKFQGTGAERKAAPRTPEELQKLKRVVQAALGIQEGSGERKDEITLEETAFEEQAAEITQKIETQERTRFWLDLGQKLLYPLLGLVVLVFLFRTIRRTRVEDIPIGLPLGDFGGGGNGNGNGNGHGGFGAGQRAGEPALVTVEVLNQLIRENPGNMTQAVRTWLTRGKPAK